MKTLGIFGVTGSIGQQVLAQLKAYPNIYKLEVVSYYENLSQLQTILSKYRSIKFVISPKLKLKSTFCSKYPGVTFFYNFADFFNHCANYKIKFDVLVNAVCGYNGYLLSYQCLSACEKLLLANKESLVMAGNFIMSKAKQENCLIAPLDSEHFALDCLLSTNPFAKKVYITCSGSSTFKPKKDFAQWTIKDVITHPVWSMGSQISVNSATLMNKCFEMIEAKYLFNLPIEKLGAFIHPQASVHALLMRPNGSFVAECTPPLMSYPICFYLFNDKVHFHDNEDFLLSKAWQFYPMNKHPLFENFNLYKEIFYSPCLSILLNIVNDYLVELFLSEKINFKQLNDRISSYYFQLKNSFIDYQLKDIDAIKPLIQAILAKLNYIT